MAILFPLFGIFTSFILIYYLSSLNKSNKYLALFFLCCNLIVMVYYGLHYSNDKFWEGFCFVNFLPLSFLLGPFLFFYVKYTLNENKRFNKWDWLHLIPAFLIVICCLPFTTLPFDRKIQIAHEIVKVTENYDVYFYLISFEFILLGRSIHLFLYCILCLIYFNRYTKQLLEKYSVLPTNHPTIRKWMLTLIFSQIFIAVNSFGHMTTLYGIKFSIFNTPSNVIFSETLYFGICGGFFFLQNFVLFLFPKILYGNISYTLPTKKESLLEEIKSSLVKQEKVDESSSDFEIPLLKYLETLPFIKKEFSISQMSFDLKIPERSLSNYFNKNLNISFSEWRKNIRIEYVCRLIEEGSAKNITIEAIASNAGFASRSKFIDAFKERKGVTPSVFIKQAANNI